MAVAHYPNVRSADLRWWLGGWWLGGVIGLIAIGSACDLAGCEDKQCGEARFGVTLRGPDVELPTGIWVVSAEIEDGTFEATCEVGGGAELTCDGGAWSVMPSRDLGAHVAFFPSLIEAGEQVSAEAQLTVLHDEQGPDSVKLEVKVDAVPLQTATFAPTYTPDSTGGEGCPICPGVAGEVLTLDP